MIQKCNKIAPLGDRVFIERDEEVSEMLGFAVGDRAKVKALTGRAVVVGKCKAVKEGDVLHLPHQIAKVEDCLIDGRELTCVKEGDLFAVEKNGVFCPINRYIKVRKCENDHVRDESGKVLLYMTENHIEFTNWVEIIDVADDCEWISKDYIGWFCLSPENDDKLQRLGRSMDYCVHESLIKFITDG